MSSTVLEFEANGTLSSERRIALTFATTIFLSAFLLFQVELIVSDYVLPWFGGSAAVWTTTMLVFQTLLFAGYAYAHWIASRAPATQKKLQLLLLAGSVLGLVLTAISWPSPVMPGAGWKPGDPDHPVITLIGILIASVGLPFFVLSTTGPLMQYWYLRSTERTPYKLYAVSNVGSLLGLLSYPFLFQPVLKLHARGWVWSALYLVFAAGIVLCASALKVREVASGTAVAATVSSGRVAAVDRFFWIALPACACICLLAGTSLISLYVVSVPLIWVVPLALYLLSFIVCFGKPHWYVRGVYHVLFAFATAGLILAIASTNVWFELGACLTLLLVVCMICNGELVRLTPDPEHVTSFYLYVSGGGALGGIAVGVIAPMIFSRAWEFQFSALAAGMLTVVLLYRDRDSWLHRSWLMPLCTLAIVLFGLPQAAIKLSSDVASGFSQMQYFRIASLLCLLVLPVVVAFLMKPKDNVAVVVRAGLAVAVLAALAYGLEAVPWGNNGRTLVRIRNFYGVLEVQQSVEERVLMHGKTVHGSQWLAPGMRRLPTTYYGEGSGFGQLLAYHPKRIPVTPMRIGVVGMGAGTIAAYGLPGDSIRFYELNPGVIDLVRGQNAYFSFVTGSPAHVEVVPGDGRLSLEREYKLNGSQNFDVLVLDAFNGDTIPVHLLTTEAIETYLRHLAPNGVLAVHVSSTTIDLSPVLSAAVAHFKLHGTMTSISDDQNKVSSDWALLSRNPEMLRTPGLARYGQPIDRGRKPVLWTDDYANIASLLYR